MKKMIARRVDAKRHALLLSCASVAIGAVALAPQRAEAQAFQGTPTYNATDISITNGTNTSTINVNAPTATIDWVPSQLDFLPSGKTATFQGSSDYTVLNRVVPVDPSQAIQLNGAIQSFVGANTGGNVWFYSPGGIVVGATATFDVGGLLLTSITPTINSTGANGFSASFSPATGDGGAISIASGAKINALASGSYVALIAPKVEQGGDVRVNGSAAYVAATSLTMTLDQGLFDIAVDLGGGTDDQNGIIHTGTTTGPANVAASDNHTIYMAAVPKNQALTMLLGGTIGFDAGAANVQNGQIILTSGSTRRYDQPFEYYAVDNPYADADITFTPGDFTSSVTAVSVSDITAFADTGDLTFGGDLWLSAFDSVHLGASGGNSLTVAGSTFLGAGGYDGTPGQILLDSVGTGSSVLLSSYVDLYATGNQGQGGDITIRADAGTLTVTGSVSAIVDGSFGEDATSDSYAGDGYGGTINVDALNSGVLTVDALGMSANGTGQNGYGYNFGEGSSSAGSGYGGDIYVDAASGGSIVVNSYLTASANGTGGNLLGGDTSGGRGQGGEIYVNTGDPYSTTGNGDLHVSGNTSLAADGTGGSVTGADATGTGGDGDGGTAIIYSWGSGDLKLDGTIVASANGAGGDGNYGGGGDGGEAAIGAVAGTVTLGGGATLTATGTGGDASVGFGGTGGSGLGGTAWIEADSDPGYPGEIDPSAGTVSGQTATIDVSGFGGIGGAGDGIDIAAGTGGEGAGGAWNGETGGAFALAQLGGGSLTLGDVTLTSNGTGGAGGIGGDGQSGGQGGEGYGGSAQAGDFDHNLVGGNDASVVFGGLQLNANGLGGDGGNAGPGGSAPGDGGDGYGGATFFNARGTATARAIRMRASGTGGAGNVGGDGQDGNVDLHAFSGSTVTITNRLQMGEDDDGIGGSGGFGLVQGGTGTAGTTSLTVDSGATVSASNAIVNAVGFGGGSTDGAAGDGLGGDASVTVAGDLKLQSSLIAYGDAVGGDSVTGTGGNGVAGSASLTIDGGNLVSRVPTSAINFVVITADAAGGGGDISGNAIGGDATLTMTANGGKLATNSLQVTSRGNYVGSGSDGVSEGGNSSGGTATIDVANALNSGKTATIALGNAYITTDSLGSNGAIAGTGTGGVTTVDFGAATTTITGLATIGANGIGGAGTVNGAEVGGDVQLTVDPAGSVSFADVDLNAVGAGGDVLISGDLGATGHVQLHSGGNITFDNISADHLSFNADGDVQGGEITAVSRVNGEAEGAVTLGDITVTDTPTTEDASVGIQSATSISVGNVSAPGAIGFATLGGLTTGNLGAGDLIIAMVGGDITTGSLTTAADGRIYLADASMFITGGGPDNFDPSVVLALDPVPTGGSITINGLVTTGQLQAAAGGDLNIGDATVGGSIDLYAGGLANFTGIVAAPTITVTSSDINIAEGAALGVYGITDLLTLNALSTGGPVIIGNTDGFDVSTEGLYHLGDEAGDIATDVLVINAAGSDVVIYNANIDGSETEGGGASSVTVNTDGSVMVLGSVLVTGAAADDNLTLNAGDRIEVNTDTGSIAMVDNDDHYSGILGLNADNVWVADGSLLSQLEEDVNFEGRDAALATNNGEVVMDGYLRAGAINAEIVDTMFVQNTGTPDDFAGITVGDGGLSITSVGSTGFAAAAAVNTQSTGASLVLFGHQILSNGTVVSGDDFAGVVELTGPIAPGSTVNGFGVPISPPVVPPPVVPPPVVPPPVVPPPVVPPPVVPPPVVPPPVVPPPVVFSSDNVLGPIGETNSPIDLSLSDDSTDQGDDEDDGDDKDKKGNGGKKTNVNAGLGLINSLPVELDLPIDDPITSGSDGLIGS